MRKSVQKGESRAAIFSLFSFKCLNLLLFFVFGFISCTTFATRPVQEMSVTHAAIRAAKEVQADTLAPEFFRQAGEWYFKAKREYKFKNFYLAKQYANKARVLAEQAEYESLRAGGSRTDPGIDLSESEGEKPKESEPQVNPAPAGTPVDEFASRKAAEEAKRTSPAPAPNSSAPTPLPPPNTR